MAKRRRKKPNISQTVLDQARQGIAGEAASPDATDATANEEPTAAVNATPATTQAPSKARRRRRDLQATQLERRKGQGALDGEYVADLLANPTKVVSEEELRADYGFVIKDLRHMGILAAALFVVLVAVSLVLL